MQDLQYLINKSKVLSLFYFFQLVFKLSNLKRSFIMKQTMYETKSNNKKQSHFWVNDKKPQLKKLITRLSQSHDVNQAQIIQQILQNRKKKIKQLRQMRANYIYQKPMIPTSSTDRFSIQAPLSSGEQYLNQKIRVNLIAPDRMYNRHPNMKAGALDESKMICYESESDPKVISKKFQQYTRLIDSQSGILKRKRFKELSNQNHSLPTIQIPYKLTMKKTYFKKFASDQFNFYKPAIKDISRSERIYEASLRQSTQRSRQVSRDFSSLKTSPRQYLTLEKSLSRDSTYRSIRTNPKTIEAVKTLDAYRQF